MAKIATLIFDPLLRQKLQALLRSQGFDVVAVTSCAKARESDAVFTECSTRVRDRGLEFVRMAQRDADFPPIIAVALESSEDLAIEAFRCGVRNFFKQPLRGDEIGESLFQLVSRAASHEGPDSNSVLVGQSLEIQQVRGLIRRLACVNSSVLITGETGTGKEVVARQIHQVGHRNKRPLVCVNCAAIPDGLLEDELFGHDRGAFTGAVSSRDGRMKEANKGTIFLDEIGDLSLMAQSKILRVIESRDVTPLGGRGTVHLDVRIIAATNRDLESMTREGLFRSDLLFRLNVARIKLPTLRERPCDIPLLIQHFLPALNRSFGCHVTLFSDRALQKMTEYSWPGNVRELKNVMEMVFINLPSLNVTVVELPKFVENLLQGPSESRQEDERERLLSVLLSTRWNVSETARKLRWSRMTVYRRLAKHRILRSDPCHTKSFAVTPCDSIVTGPVPASCDRKPVTQAANKNARQPLTSSL